LDWISYDFKSLIKINEASEEKVERFSLDLCNKKWRCKREKSFK